MARSATSPVRQTTRREARPRPAKRRAWISSRGIRKRKLRATGEGVAAASPHCGRIMHRGRGGVYSSGPRYLAEMHATRQPPRPWQIPSQQSCRRRSENHRTRPRRRPTTSSRPESTQRDAAIAPPCTSERRKPPYVTTERLRLATTLMPVSITPPAAPGRLARLAATGTRRGRTPTASPMPLA